MRLFQCVNPLFASLLGLLTPFFIFCQDSNNQQLPISLEQAQAVFEENCVGCHRVGTSLDSKELTPSYWHETIIRMARKPHADISPTEIPAIYDYLVFDSATRRKKKLEATLKKLSSDERRSEEAQINAILKKYQSEVQ